MADPRTAAMKQYMTMISDTFPLPREAASKDLCSDCGEKVLLEVHYCEPNRGKYSENEGAIRLCSDCHRARHVDHNGDYWKDPLEMAAYWLTWDYECGDLGDGGRFDNRGSL